MNYCCAMGNCQLCRNFAEWQRQIREQRLWYHPKPPPSKQDRIVDEETPK